MSPWTEMDVGVRLKRLFVNKKKRRVLYFDDIIGGVACESKSKWLDIKEERERDFVFLGVGGKVMGVGS